jgi:putative colanic acid biosynthesis UDP-glucose lipid carrier transferase
MEKKLKISYLIINFLLLNLAFGFSNQIIFDTFWVDGWAYPSLFIVVNITFIISFFASSQQQITANQKFLSTLFSNIELISYFSFFVLLYWFLVDSQKYYKIGLLLFYLFFISFKLISDFFWVRYLRNKNLVSDYLNILVLGKESKAIEFKDEINSQKWLGLKIVSIDNNDFNTLFDHESLSKNNIKQVFIHSDEFIINEEFEMKLRLVSEKLLIKFFIFSNIYQNKISKNSSTVFGKTQCVNLFLYPLDGLLSRFIKRTFDVFFSLFIILFIFSWLFPVIALLIFLDNPGSIFYRQKRHGANNEVFKCLKFRSMKIGNNKDFVQATKNDNRITRVGKLLRKSSIDELPQFFNVLIGDMSIVGPRPHAIEHNKEFAEKIDNYYSRHLFKPGITGLAQVKGYRGETDTLEKMQFRVKFDRYYIQNWSFLLDLKIIFLTVYNVVRGEKNAY